MLILYNSTFYSTEEKKSTTNYKQKSRDISIYIVDVNKPTPVIKNSFIGRLGTCESFEKSSNSLNSRT